MKALTATPARLSQAGSHSQLAYSRPWRSYLSSSAPSYGHSTRAHAAAVSTPPRLLLSDKGSLDPNSALCSMLLMEVADAKHLQESRHPAPTTPAHVLDVLELTYEAMEDIFMSRRGYIIPKKEKATVDATGGSATYGEAMPEGISALLQQVPLPPTATFVDLGSGLGRIVLQVACSVQVARCVGLELSDTRQEQAEWALAQLREHEGLLRSRVELVAADIMSAELEGGTHFFLCSTAFSGSACRRLAERLARLRSFQVLVTSRALPFQPHLQMIGQFPCAMSWNLRGTAYVYCKSYQAAPREVLANFIARDGACWLPGVGVPPLTFLPIAADDLMPGQKLDSSSAAAAAAATKDDDE